MFVLFAFYSAADDILYVHSSLSCCVCSVVLVRFVSFYCHTAADDEDETS